MMSFMSLNHSYRKKNMPDPKVTLLIPNYKTPELTSILSSFDYQIIIA